MKMATLSYTFGIIILISLSSTAKADTNRNTATANCREEAVSTGLEDEADITAYIELCMQAWQSPPEYEETGEPAMETPESMNQ